MKMEAARATVADQPDEAARVLADVAAGTRRAIEEVRRVTYDLRPPALDELGLVGALREQAAAFAGVSTDALQIELEVLGDLSVLSAATEVAAYRIALEALTNVARHSGAYRASIVLKAEGRHLMVEVRDDGRGLGDDPPGIGVRSMRERAEEVGGSLEIVEAIGGGTRVCARLPLVDLG
jgi:signal transduction histidine kinase